MPYEKSWASSRNRVRNRAIAKSAAPLSCHDTELLLGSRNNLAQPWAYSTKGQTPVAEVSSSHRLRASRYST